MSGRVNFVVFMDEGVWVAHGIEHNLVTSGPTLQTVRKRINALVRAYREESKRLKEDLIGKIPPAPDDIRERFNEAVASGRYLDDHCEAPDDRVGFVLKVA